MIKRKGAHLRKYSTVRALLQIITRRTSFSELPNPRPVRTMSGILPHSTKANVPVKEKVNEYFPAV